MFPRTGPRQSQLLYPAGVFLTLALIAGCGDSVPPSPNPLPPPIPGGRDPNIPKSMLKPRHPIPAGKMARTGKVPGKR